MVESELYSCVKVVVTTKNKFKLILQTPPQTIIRSKVLRRLALLATLARRGLGRLGGQEFRVDIRQDTSLRNDDVSKETVELLVVADRELEVTGNDARLLVVTVGSESAGARWRWSQRGQD